MIILHAGFVGEKLFLWGEMPCDHLKRGKPGEIFPARLPFAASAEGLTAGLGQAGLILAGSARRCEERVIWLPTVDGIPLASSPLISEPPGHQMEAEIAPWGVTTIALATFEAVDLLCRCAGARTLAPGVIIGDDLTYWVQSMRFAGALVARQQYLPSMAKREAGFRAVWEPMLLGKDAERLATLAAAMPGTARAVNTEAFTPPENAPAELLTIFLREVADYLIRAACNEVAPEHLRRRNAQAKAASVHDAWLNALRATDGTLQITPEEYETLAQQMQEWHRPITVAAAAPYRLCFRLDEPSSKARESRFLTDDASDWHVRFLLQASDDPSLLLPAAEVWNAKGRKAALLSRGDVPPQEYLLTALGQASELCSRIEESLKTAKPDSYTLDGRGAYEFLTVIAPALEEVGFGLMLPAWWTRKGGRARLRARARVSSPVMQNASGLSLDEMLNFDWEVALGDENLSLDDLRALAALKSPLVQVRGQWVELRGEEIQAAIEFLENPGGTASARDIIRMALGDGTAPGGLPVDGVTASGWMGDLLAEMEHTEFMDELPPPAGFTGTLRPYQARGYAWLAFLRKFGLGACLADDMGLGKTIQALALLQRDREAGHLRPVLLICPTSVVGNWQKEAQRFTPDLPVLIHHGITREKGENFKKVAERHGLIVTSYALLYRDFEAFKRVRWGGIILDEAQNIKNPTTKQARAARALKAEYRFALTGTPVENHVGELWSIMEFLNPGFLGSSSDFHERFFIPLQAHQDPEAAARLKRLTGPFLLRRLKTDKSIIADLPEKLEMKVFCSLTKEQASLYKAVVEETSRALEEADGIQRSGVVLSTLLRLKQVCNHPAHFLKDNSALPGRSGKLSRLTEMLEEMLELGERALIFTQFTEMGELLKRHLQETFGREVLYLHGGVSKPNRDRMVERFQEDPNGPAIFLLSLKAGGTGLNLTSANHVFHFDRWWNPAVENQATDRAFRIGQTRNVQVHKFLCAGTLEERIDEMIERKKDIAASVVGSGESWLTKLSTEELRDLFALREDAVAE